jgi:hypothetical protein
MRLDNPAEDDSSEFFEKKRERIERRSQLEGKARISAERLSINSALLVYATFCR